ncbi:MAG: restriction endonuclease subunit S [Geobacteraceae bacterium]|nr:restriction endonuclease subunit S [Geobacteraceae bacterium]
MKVELRKIASIQIGYTFRGRLDVVPSGAVAIIQMKDLIDDQVDLSGLLQIDMEQPKEHHLAMRGDLIFRSRGVTNTCAILSDNPGNAVVAAPLFRIRLTDSGVLAEYLNWYINSPPAQSFLATHSKGTAQKMISKDALEALEIAVPSLERQKAIVELSVLVEREQSLIKKLAEKRKQYLSAKLLNLAEGEANR